MNSISGFELSQILKKDIKEYFTTLKDTFQETSGKAFLVKHTRKIDTIIIRVYNAVLQEVFGEYQPDKNSIPITLVALGSYGREEMNSRSDIDIMIAYKDVIGFNSKEIIEKILYILWDVGLKLGHRVHEVDELRDIAKSDITIKTAIMESRFIDGSNILWGKIEDKIRDIISDNQEEYITAKIDAREKSHQKSPIMMEPNLKDGVGGFRDANTVFWIGKVLYGISHNKELPSYIMQESDYREFRLALDFLFRVRSALHLVTNKKEDKLRLHLIPDVSKMLGYEDNKKEQMRFASRVISNLKIVNLYSNIWIDKMIRDIGIYNEPKTYLDEWEPSTLKQALRILNSNEDDNLKVSTKFIKYMIDAKRPEVIDKRYYSDIKNIFYQKKSHIVIDAIASSMLLGYLIPPLKKVINLPQFDGYHKYSVGIHSMKSLYHLEHIEDEFLLELYNSLKKDEKAMLKMVVLLHDCGKGREREHAVVGASLFKDFAKLIGVKDDLIEIGNKLILQHSTMSIVAQKENLYSHTTIYKFVNIFNSKSLLNMIYLLTYADMKGVGKDIYNSFNSGLIRTLYDYSIEALAYNDTISDMSKRVRKENSLKRSKRFNNLSPKIQKKILALESDLFFIKYKRDEILDIIEKTSQNSDDWYNIANSKFLSIEIMRRDNLNLNFLLNQLSYLELKNMDIFRLYDNNKYFRLDFSNKIDDSLLFNLERIIQKALIVKDIKQPKNIKLKKSNITIDCDYSKSCATMQIVSPDERGLMAFLMGIFDRLGISIISAKVHTHKHKIQDLFLIEKNNKFCVNQELIMEELTKDIIS
ncbi:Possible nucleotidyltransferase [hydrothermal vent metagenome]|uniref:Possible nucleotidyltransferase n=1 Tax=hydrothermal vent metagenome TaxID=652676 RepID=A0A1W1EHT9_9ZZZZ